MENLTNHEKEVLELLQLGLTNKEIAEKMNISTHTVKTHLANLYRKLGVFNRLQAMIVAIKNGILKFEDLN